MSTDEKKPAPMFSPHGVAKVDDWIDDSMRMFMQAMGVEDRQRWGMLVFLNKLVSALSNDRLYMVLKVGAIIGVVAFVIGYLVAFQTFIVLPQLGGGL